LNFETLKLLKIMDPKELQRIKQQFSIIGTNPQLNHCIEIAAQVALTDLSVLITGESGVGKEHFPKIIHTQSARKHGPYFAINCGAIPEGTIDAELFGHTKGAFTDAKSERKGYFEIANGGTLFLDEVGELPLSTQARLLRVLETGEFIRVGSSDVQKTNVRVVAATNLNIPKAIEEGRFREDLFYRLNTIEIKVPALRERKEDIALLFRKFVVDFAEKYHMPAIRLSEDATELLQSYYWQGNVRQLKNVAQQVSLLEERRDITAENLAKYLPANEMHSALAVVDHPRSNSQDAHINEQLQLFYKIIIEMKREIDQLKEQVAAGAVHEHTAAQEDIVEWQPKNIVEVADIESEVVTIDDATNSTSKPQSMMEIERNTIHRTLIKNQNNRKATAAELGLSERTLYRKIKDYGL
jgi:transcriptional regulator with PAS, ATPase and Fis domain